MARMGSVAWRRDTAIESFRNAGETLGELRHGMALFAITRGQWSMIDAVLHVLACVGEGAAISLWTWTVAEYEVETLTRLQNDRRIRDGLLVIDGGARAKNAGLIAEWKKVFGELSVRYVRNHSKIATVSGNGWRFLLRGSMNLNWNPRFEQFDLTEGGADFDLVREIEGELLVLQDDASNSEVLNATKVLKAFDPETLAIFGGLKTWRP